MADGRLSVRFDDVSFAKPIVTVSAKGLQATKFRDHLRYDLTPPSEPTDFSENLAPQEPYPISTLIEPLVAVIGVGYVGQHLVHVFSKTYNVLGYDVSETRIQDVRKQFEGNDRARFTTLPTAIRHATHFLIAVPTLLLPDRSIDSSFLRSALKTVSRYAGPGSTIVVESSVAVGMTREFLGPLAAERGFFAGMSPERVDPGRTEPPAHAIPKIISGLDDVVSGSLYAIYKLYSKVFDHVVPVSRPEVAEMTKLYENCQRMICIAYANEMADACLVHRIDPFEVCDAAATKPFGYMPFAPSVGVGGHCIPINPHYLLANNRFPLLQAASDTMANRPAQIAERIAASLGNQTGLFYKPSVLVVGMGFKQGQSHLANSPGLELAKTLVLTGAVEVTWADPLVPQEAIPQIPRLADHEWSVAQLESNFELIVVALKQDRLDFSVLDLVTNVKVELWCH